MKYFLLTMAFVLPIVFSGCSDEDEEIGILLPENEFTLTVGEAKQMTYTLSPKNAENAQVIWASSNYNIAYITEKGELIGYEEGVAEITAELSGSHIQSTCKVKVVPANVAGITLNKSEMNITLGNTFTLIPTFIPGRAKNKIVTWSSSNILIATVDTKGIVTANFVGRCVIKAISEDGNFQATCEVNVLPVLIKGIQFNSDIYQMEIGTRKRLVAIVTPEKEDNQQLLFWKSTNPQVATVNDDGFVRAIDYGTTSIVAEMEDGQFTTSCLIEVVDMNRFIDLSFTLSEASNTNGYFSGTVYCHITNNSSETIKLTDFYVRDSSNGLKIEIEDKEQLSILTPGSRASWGFNLNNYYHPVYTYEYEYGWQLYAVSKPLTLEFN